MNATTPEELKTFLRRLAEWEAPEGTAIISAYLDSRSEASGERPGQRTAEIFLKDRLHNLDKSLQPRGPGLDSFRIDRPRIEEAFANADPAAEGVAIFSCGAADLFEVIEVGAPFKNKLAYQQRAALFPLARLVDEYEPAVVAVADTNTLRVFSMRLGNLEELTGDDKDSIHFQKRSTGGYSEARYQRHIDKHRQDFANEAAEMIARLVEEEGATRLVLAGDEVAIPLLKGALPQRVADKIAGDTLRIHIRANRNEIVDEVAELLDEAEREASQSIADQLVGEVREDDLGVAGEEATLKALQQGMVDTLVLKDGYEPVEVRDEYTRLAIETSAAIEVVSEHEGLEKLGGIGAILRYRY